MILNYPNNQNFENCVTITIIKLLIETSKMNSLLLGRNGRLLMPIFALFLMNVPVAEAKVEWPEGTMGNLAMVGLVFTSIIVGSGLLRHHCLPV